MKRVRACRGMPSLFFIYTLAKNNSGSRLALKEVVNLIAIS